MDLTNMMNTTFQKNEIDLLKNVQSENELVSIITQTIIGFLTFSCTIWTVLGNIFVLYAITTNRVLKATGISNYLIGNLAISDLLLGCTVLPFSSAFSTFKVWPFGKIFCNIWLSIDVLCCTASIWCLCIVAYDRYIATNQPVHYRTRKNSVKTALIYCTIPWIISVILSIGPFFFSSGSNDVIKNDKNNNYLRYNNEYFNNKSNKTTPLSITTKQTTTTMIVKMTKNETEDLTCILFNTPSFVVGSSFFSFYLPLIIMCFLYSRVFITINQQSKRFHRRKSSIAVNLPKKRAKGGNSKQKTRPKEEKLENLNSIQSNDTNQQEKLITNKESPPQNHHTNIPNHYQKDKTPHQKTIQMLVPHREHHINSAEARITKTLAIIMGCFIACWLPFFSIYIFRSLVSDPSIIPDYMMDFFIWLGYLNSSLNPIIYLIVNVNFRNSMREVIKCQFLRNKNKNNNYKNHVPIVRL